ncbi:MAG: 5-(carboxyamino)imidazole ribonucleotide synthase [Candidatus Methylacidiphilales bacterium]
MILPGATIGCLGGGQLGRMLGIEARRLGYGFRVFEPAADCPAAQVSDHWMRAAYHDDEALDAFASSVDVVTFEFENIPSTTVNRLAQAAPVFPSAEVLHTTQNREREKNFLKSNGFPHAAFRVVTDLASLERAVKELGRPCVLKTADFGYDGKGQVKITMETPLNEAWSGFEGKRAVLEEWVDFELECSVVCARTAKGEVGCFPAAENIHTRHILDFSMVPGRFSAGTARRAQDLARAVTEQLGVVGMLGVEMFLDRAGDLRVNELAPRTHNSGHFTLDACVTSQFEQQIRAICGLPMGGSLGDSSSDFSLRSPVVMVNLLGDLWRPNVPDWSLLMRQPGVRLHLYGKAEARPGRKMGHFCVLDSSLDSALALAHSLKNSLSDPSSEPSAT